MEIIGLNTRFLVITMNATRNDYSSFREFIFVSLSNTAMTDIDRTIICRAWVGIGQAVRRYGVVGQS